MRLKFDKKSGEKKKQKTMPSSQIKIDGGVWLKYFQTVLPKKVYGPYLWSFWQFLSGFK
jgi:hypothetical protein